MQKIYLLVYWWYGKTHRTNEDFCLDYTALQLVVLLIEDFIFWISLPVKFKKRMFLLDTSSVYPFFLQVGVEVCI